MSGLPRGRPRRYAEYEQLVAGLPKVMTKRPKYANNIGVFRGARGETAWIKIHLPQGATYKGKSYPPGGSLEIKLGRRSSWSWSQLEAKRDEIQGKIDRGEPLEEDPAPLFADWAGDWLRRAKERLKGYATAKIHLERQWLPVFGSVQLSNIQTHQINGWIGKRLKQAKPATVKRELATLDVILNNAVKAGHI